MKHLFEDLKKHSLKKKNCREKIPEVRVNLTIVPFKRKYTHMIDSTDLGLMKTATGYNKAT